LGTGDAAKQATMEKERLTYTQPQSEIIEIRMMCTLLTVSDGKATNDGYGDAIPEGEGGWH